MHAQYCEALFVFVFQLKQGVKPIPCSVLCKNIFFSILTITGYHENHDVKRTQYIWKNILGQLVDILFLVMAQFYSQLGTL